VGSELNSESKGREFESCLIQNGDGVKTMPGSVLSPNYGLIYGLEKSKLVLNSLQSVTSIKIINKIIV